MDATSQPLVIDSSAIAAATRPRNALTVDVEEYFQVAAFERTIPRNAWDAAESRVEFSTGRVLDLFAERGCRATFFVLGWIAERHPSLVRRIVADGHELASHGYDHTRVHQLTPEQFRADVVKTKRILEDIGGVGIRGYRAPSYSINGRNLWAHDILLDTGHVYSSSIYPIRHDLYGMPEAPRFSFRFKPDGIQEVPVTTVRIGGNNYPCGGGGYFRLMPYGAFRWMLSRVNDRDGQSGLFYFHPWEVDPSQPRVQGAPLKSRFRHYLNLDSMHARLGRLLTDFRWGRMDEIFLSSSSPLPFAGEVARSAGEGSVTSPGFAGEVGRRPGEGAGSAGEGK
ncbi:MAG TPA: XrtA system polysaccharide deacetylase [Steroidobacteraceae bacterium]|nr:XrtA system polysaccharide deacetylase [Steroidobacteraceae bacterium]